MSELVAIKGYDNYFFNSDLEIVNKFGKKMKQQIGSTGYKCLHLNHNKMVKVHRLIASTFIPNPNNYPCVNHKDENKLNNSIDNLEWCSYEYNSNYGTSKERISKANKNNPAMSKQVDMLDRNGKYIKTFPSAKEAERILKGKNANTNIIACCKGKRKTACGYKWRYSNE